MDTDAPTLFERVGGMPAVLGIVDGLYAKAKADPELEPYFHTTDLGAQRQRLAEMIGQALGGPAAPWLKGLREAHAGRGITHRHFSLMAAHLMDVLIEIDLDPDEADLVMNWIAQGRDAVVEDPDY